MHRDDHDRPQAQSAWRAFEISGKVADYLSYAQCAHGRELPAGEPEREDGRDADKDQGPGAQAAEYR